MLKFRDNYFGWDTNIISAADYKACGQENLRSRFALRNWHESKEGAIRMNLYNTMDIHVTMNARNAVLVLPIALYPHMDERGMLTDPDANTITLHTSRIGFESRYFYNRFLEMSVNVSPVRIQLPSARNLGTSRMPFEDFMVTSAYEDEAEYLPDSSNIVHSPLADAYSAAAAAAAAASPSSVHGSEKLYAEMPQQFHYQYEGNNEFMQDKKYGISKLSTSQLIWDGLEAQTLMLFGRGAGRIAPCVTYHRERKVRVGTLRGDVQHAQIKAIVDASTTFESSWRQTSKEGSGGVVEGHSTGVAAKPGYRFKVHLHSAMFLPKGSEAFYSFQAYAWAQVTCDGEIFHTQVVPDSSSPEWDCLLDFRKEELQDLVIQVFDGAYGRKRLIGEVVFLQENLEKIVKPADAAASGTPDLGWYIIDASKCAPCYTKVKTSRDIERQFQRYWKNRRNQASYCDAVKAEYVHGSSGSRKLFGKLRFGVSIAEEPRAPPSVEEDDIHASVAERYTYASLRWGTRASGEYEGEEEGVLGERVDRLVAALRTEDVVKIEADKYSQNAVTLTCGGMDLSLWTPNGTGITKLSLSSFTMLGDSLISKSIARKLVSEEEINFAISHYISVPTRQYTNRLKGRPIPGTQNWRHFFKRGGQQAAHPHHHHHHHRQSPYHPSHTHHHSHSETKEASAEGTSFTTEEEGPMAHSYVWVEVGKVSAGAAVKLYEKLPCNTRHMEKQRAFFRIHDEERQQRKHRNEEVTTGINEPWQRNPEGANIQNMQGGTGRIPLSVAHAMGLALMPMAYTEQEPRKEPEFLPHVDDLLADLDPGDSLDDGALLSASESFQSAEEEVFSSADELASELSSSSSATSSLTATDEEDSGYSSEESSSSAGSYNGHLRADPVYVCASSNIKFPLQRAGIGKACNIHLCDVRLWG